jgi:uncharacterized protein (DUF58 family)
MTPSRNILLLAALLSGLALLTAYVPGLDPAWLALGGLVAGTAGLDLVLGRPLPPLTLRRRIHHSIPVGTWSRVELELENRGWRALRLRVHDHHPQGFVPEGMPCELALPARRLARVRYRVRPQRRGDGAFHGLDLVVDSPLGLWQRRHFLSLPEVVKVFPNFREVSRYALLAVDHRLSQIGVRPRRRRGEGNDFHQLRSYRPGDSLRQIDWKATSRYRKPISKEYQDERDQQLVFLLDCGRRMRHADGTGEHLDQALNAMLLLTYVAHRQGDAVGFMAFGGDRRWYPPQKGGDLVRRFLERTYDIQSSVEAADYLGAARELARLQRRRALVVILTNTRDEDHAELLQAVRILASQHLVVLADLRESLLDAALLQPVRDLDGALRFQAVTEYLESRTRGHEALRHHGALIFDLIPDQLPVALVNQYLTIKASGRL